MNFSGKYGSSPKISALRAPPKPARPQPNAKVNANTCGTLMPSPIAARGSSTAARNRLPNLVRACEHLADQLAGDKCQRQRGQERPTGSIDQHRVDIAAGHCERAMGQID